MNEHDMNQNIASDVLERYSKVAVIGAGVIGASWTAVFSRARSLGRRQRSAR